MKKFKQKINAKEFKPIIEAYFGKILDELLHIKNYLITNLIEKIENNNYSPKSIEKSIRNASGRINDLLENFSKLLGYQEYAYKFSPKLRFRIALKKILESRAFANNARSALITTADNLKGGIYEKGTQRLKSDLKKCSSMLNSSFKKLGFAFKLS